MSTEPHQPPHAEQDPAAVPPVAEGEAAGTGSSAADDLPPLADDVLAEQKGTGRRPRRRGPGGRPGRSQHGERGAKPGRPRVEKATRPEVDPIAAKAVLISAEMQPVFYSILEKRDIERPVEQAGDEASAGEDELEDIPLEEWSYKAFTRYVATSKLGFSYNAKQEAGTKRRGRKRGDERPYKEVRAVQVAAEHSSARDKIITLITGRFAADMARIDAAIAEARTKAGSDGKAEAVLAHVEEGISLTKWLEKNKLRLEYLRLDAIRDAADWFDMRVSQVEGMMDEITKRTAVWTDVDSRVAKLSTDPNFLRQLAELDADLAMFDSFNALSISAGADRIKGVISGIVADAKRKKARLDAQRSAILKYTVRERWDEDAKKFVPAKEDEKGMNMVERAEYRAVDQLLMGDTADLVRDAALAKMIGLSPEQEVAFWNAMRETFLEATGDLPPGLKGADRARAVRARFEDLNGALQLSRYDETSGSYFLIDPDNATNPGENQSEGAGQLLAKCLAEAMVVEDVKKGLDQVMYAMGPVVKRAVSGLLRGKSNTVKIEALARLAKVDEKGRPAGGVLREKYDQAAAAIKDQLDGKNPRELRWNRKEEPKDADQPYIVKIRAKAFELLGMDGSMKGQDLVVLNELLFPTPKETEGAAAKEAVPASTEPLADQIKNGTLDETLFEGADARQDSLALYQQRLAAAVAKVREAIPNRVGHEAVLDQISGLVDSKGGTISLELVRTFIQRLETFADTARAFQKAFGIGWHKRFEFVKENTAQQAGDKRFQPNTELIIHIMQQMAGDTSAPMAIMLSGDPVTVAKATLHEVGKADVVTAENAATICAAVAGLANEGKLADISAELVDKWLAGEGSPDAEADADAERAENNVLRAILDGNISNAIVAEAYPAKESKAAMTAAELKQELTVTVDGIREASHSLELTQFIVDHFGLVLPEGQTPAEQVRTTVETLVAIETMFEQMNAAFGSEWASGVGLIIADKDDARRQVLNEKVLTFSLEYCAETDVLNAFAFDQNPEAEQGVYKQLDSAARDALSGVGIGVQDQLYFAFKCISISKKETLPHPNVGLSRMAKCFAFGSRSRKRGDELLAYLHLKEGDSYNDKEIVEVITNENWDA
jgi:hypothetical protein